MYRPYWQQIMKAGLLFAVLLLPSLLWAQVQVTINRSEIALGETATLNVTISGLEVTHVPEMPAVEGLGISQSTAGRSVNIVNGVQTTSVVVGYTIRPNKEGEFTIGPVKVTAGGKVHQSSTIRLKVTAARAPAASSPQNEVGNYATLNLAVPRKEVYVGEVFPVDITLMLQALLQNYQPPEAEGFSLSSPARHTRENAWQGNARWEVNRFRHAARAVKAGELTLGPATASIVVRVPTQENDPFFGGTIRTFRNQPATVKSEVLKLKVLPLPEEGKPAGFNGAVGKFTFRIAPSKTEVNVGDPVSLIMEVTGSGAWDAVQPPAMDMWRDFKIYSSNSEFKPLDDLGIQGVKRFEVVVVPENSDVKEIPAMAFSYFDTDARKYESIQVAATPIKVKASTAAPVQPTVSSGKAATAKTEEAPAAKDILHIKPHFGTLAGVSAPLAVRPWFWALNVLPLLLWAALAIWRKQTEAASRNPRLQRAKAVAESEAAGLKELSSLAAGGRSKEFFDLLAKLLQERLGERLDLPSSAITELVIDQHLTGTPEILRRELHELFQACDLARYAPVSDAAKLDALADKAGRVLNELRQQEVKR